MSGSVQLNELSVDDVIAWSWPLKLGLLAATGLGLATLIWWLWGADIKAHRMQLYQQEDFFKQQYWRQTSALAGANQLIVQKDALKHWLAPIMQPVEASTIVDKVTRSGMSNHLDLVDISLGKWVNKSFYQQLPVQVYIRGHYHAIGAFFGDLLATPPLMTVHNFELQGSADDGQLLQLKVHLKAYSQFNFATPDKL